MRRPLALLGLAAVAAGAFAACGDDEDSASTVPTLVIDDDLVVGDTYSQGGVSLTVHRVTQDGDLVVAVAEACLAPGTPAGIPIDLAAWQLRVVGQDESIARTVVRPPPPALRPQWPPRLALPTGDCFRGKVPFRVDPAAVPRQVVFAQLGQPVAWAVPVPG